MGYSNVSSLVARKLRAPKKIVFVVNVDWFFCSHRLPIGLRAIESGYEVHVACAITNRKDQLESMGFIVHSIKIARGKKGFVSNAIAFLEIYKLYLSVKPDLVHLVTIKPVLFGGIAARLARVNSVVSAISGLGYVFVTQSFWGRIQRFVISTFYGFALKHKNLRVIVQNTDDRDLICKIACLPTQKVTMIRGSGVDLKEYRAVPIGSGIPVVIFAGRLLRDKGVREFVAAAEGLVAKGVIAKFLIFGDLDPDNPASLTNSDLQAIHCRGVVECQGYSSQMNAMLSMSSIVVLPSYREGLPKVLLEAAACGRVVVTTDVPGCRDAIEPGKTGLLVPARDAEALADAIAWLLENPEVCAEMGREGRLLAERAFDVETVVGCHLDIYRELLAVAA